MSKFGKVSMIMALVAMMATPALAEYSLSGYYRLQGYAFDRNFGADEDTSSFIDQRLRMKFTSTLNDYVAVVYYGEVDAPFGEQSKGGIGGGGQINTDGVNVETKNAYVDFKIPNSTWAVRTGLQGWGTGNDYESLVIDSDMAAINARGEVGPIILDVVYSKWNEGIKETETATDAVIWVDANEDGIISLDELATDTAVKSAADRASWDDFDFYGAKATFKASEQLSLGAIAMFQDNNAIDAEYMYYGVNGDFRFANYGVKSFFLFGDADSTALDGNSWVFDVAGFAKVANGNMKLHFAYFPDDEEAVVFKDSNGDFEYHNDNLQLFLTDVFYNNGGSAAYALENAAYAGNGLWFVTFSGDMALPQDSYLKYGTGYFSSVEDEGREGSSLGIEVAAMVGKKFAEVYDLSLRGAYAILGDYYDGTAAGSDPEDPWQVVAMLNVAF